MANNSKQITRVPVALTAPSMGELSLACLRNNLKHQTEFHYFQIVKDGKQWVAWYYADLEKYPVLNKK